MFIIVGISTIIMENIDTEHYFNTADEFIFLANTHLENSTAPRISNIMMYATARFNAYTLASQTENKEIFKKEKTENIEFLVEAYKKSLEEHYDDYIENFDEYLERN